MVSPDSAEFNPGALAALLERDGMTQAELARRAGLSHRNSVNKILKGQKQVSGNELIRFCLIFQTPVAAFMKPA